MNISSAQLANMLRSIANQPAQSEQAAERQSQQTPGLGQCLSTLGESVSSPEQNDLQGGSALQSSLRQLSNQCNLDSSLLSALSAQLTPNIEAATNRGE